MRSQLQKLCVILFTNKITSANVMYLLISMRSQIQLQCVIKITNEITSSNVTFV